ncbi:hypothetical protein GLOTRDRAFT_133218 [Gloeophyllum trabeum ATCC 11539]|uniref:Uncharacterized protein n=1 Tax=Gloeophyllum trabeum (strain ATCC 11539 / FP-39264 / Madison 617) TaxID=670483 RepID=S7PV26_GLOTA|nr:uncharacterized protein GLOTRDRAFT_133218 [Gloeophyllum trabeum ATCC 11539]EPQ51348.1 hypothetical protein GLOTRDRAFT_133218 [Gloeophyllum trabeum ATCC 11539]
MAGAHGANGAVPAHYLSFTQFEGLDWDRMCRKCCENPRCAVPAVTTRFRVAARDDYEVRTAIFVARYDHVNDCWPEFRMGVVVGHLCVKDKDGNAGRALFVTEHSGRPRTSLFFPQFGETASTSAEAELKLYRKMPEPPTPSLLGGVISLVYAQARTAFGNGPPAYKWVRAKHGNGPSHYIACEGPWPGMTLEDTHVLPYRKATERVLRERGEDVCEYRP